MDCVDLSKESYKDIAKGIQDSLFTSLCLDVGPVSGPITGRSFNKGIKHIGSTSFPSDQTGMVQVGLPIIDFLVVCENRETTERVLSGLGYKKLPCDGLSKRNASLFVSAVGDVAVHVFVADCKSGELFIAACLDWTDRFQRSEAVYRRDFMTFKIQSNKDCKSLDAYTAEKQKWFDNIYISYQAVAKSKIEVQVEAEAQGWDTDTESDSPTGREMMTNVGLHTYN